MGGSQRRHGMAHGAVGEHHGSWGAGKCRSTQGRVDGEFSDQERCLRLALPSAGSAVGGRLDRHRADSRRAVAPAERGPARALGASKRHKPREWPRSGVQPQRYAVRLSREKLFFSEIPGLFMGMEQFLTSSRPTQYDENSDGCAPAALALSGWTSGRTTTLSGAMRKERAHGAAAARRRAQRWSSARTGTRCTVVVR